MARPKKQGLDYFTNDVNFYQDIKIRKLIRHKGVQAVSVYHILLCQIYASGYYLPWDEDLPFIVSEISGLEEDTIQDIINYCITIGLFDKTVFDTHQVLTSHGIQERYISFCTVAKRKLPDNTPYLLVNLNPNQVNSDKKVVSSEQTLFNTEEINDNTEETPNNSGKSTQSKVKESKEKHSSSANTRTHESETAIVAVDDDQRVCDSIDDEITQLRASPLWREHVFMRFKFLGRNEQLLDEWLARWGAEVKISGKCHVNLGDAKHHFCSWMIIQEGKISKSGNHGTDNNNGYRSNEDIISGAVGIIQRMSTESPKNLSDIPVV